MREHTHCNTLLNKNSTHGIIFDYIVGDDWQTYCAYLFIAMLGAVMASVAIYMAAVYLI